MNVGVDQAGQDEAATSVDLGVRRAGVPVGHVDDHAVLDHHRGLAPKRHRGSVENEAVGHDGAHGRSVGAHR